MKRHPSSIALGSTLSQRALAQLIDISAVQAFHTETEVRYAATAATQYGFIAVHALSNFVPMVRTLVAKGGATLVGGSIGFPSGGTFTSIKVAEAIALVEAGADELDMMVNVGRLKSGDLRYVVDEIREVVAAVTPVPLKVILEVGHLEENEIRRGSEAAVEGGAAFVKTGTGWLPSGTSVEQIRVIAETVQGAVEIKAAGGIRSLSLMAEMIGLGVTRFGVGTGHALALIKECASLPGGSLHVGQHEPFHPRKSAAERI